MANARQSTVPLHRSWVVWSLPLLAYLILYLATAIWPLQVSLPASDRHTISVRADVYGLEFRLKETIIGARGTGFRSRILGFPPLFLVLCASLHLGIIALHRCLWHRHRGPMREGEDQ